MAPALTVYDHIRRNNIKTILLILMFPITLCLILFGALCLIYGFGSRGMDEALALFLSWAPLLIFVGLIWMILVCFCGDKILLGFVSAEFMNKRKYKYAYNLVENVALAAGMPTPRVYIIHDDGLNAFATGYSIKTASIALTTGLLLHLTPAELEGVIAHEIAHIKNRDMRLNLIIAVGLGIFAMLGRGLLTLRVSRNGKNQSGVLILVLGLVLVIFSWAIAPLIHLAISRTNEYNADATAALITRNPMALADALHKVEMRPGLKGPCNSLGMRAMCISDPSSDPSSLIELTSTHPMIENRIHRLHKMARRKR